MWGVFYQDIITDHTYLCIKLSKCICQSVHLKYLSLQFYRHNKVCLRELVPFEILGIRELVRLYWTSTPLRWATVRAPKDRFSRCIVVVSSEFCENVGRTLYIPWWVHFATQWGSTVKGRFFRSPLQREGYSETRIFYSNIGYVLAQTICFIQWVTAIVPSHFCIVLFVCMIFTNIEIKGLGLTPWPSVFILDLQIRIWICSHLWPKHNVHYFKRFWFQGIPPSVYHVYHQW